MRWVKRALLVVLAAIALAIIAIIGFYFRPVSYFNARTYLQEHFVGFENHSVKVDGYRMHYLAMGPASGPAVILVHGLGVTPKTGGTSRPFWPRRASASTCPT